MHDIYFTEIALSNNDNPKAADVPNPCPLLGCHFQCPLFCLFPAPHNGSAGMSANEIMRSIGIILFFIAGMKV